jgi:hypothetical protein
MLSSRPPGWKASPEHADASRAIRVLAVVAPEDERRARGGSHEPEQHPRYAENRRLYVNLTDRKGDRAESEREVIDRDDASEPLAQILDDHDVRPRRDRATTGLLLGRCG